MGFVKRIRERRREREARRWEEALQEVQRLIDAKKKEIEEEKKGQTQSSDS